MSGPSADVSCRVAWADDAPAIARLQLSTRRTDLGDLLPPHVLDVDPDLAAEAWRTTLVRPPAGRVRVLVALERNRVTGFAITSPALDPDCDPVADAELMEFTVGAADRGHGHGSRLLQAAVDTLVADRFDRAVLWARAEDDVLRRFLGDAGWGADGAHRELDLDGTGAVTVKQVRLHSQLTGP